MIPSDGFTHMMLLGYHAGIEDDLPAPTLSADEVEQEILADEWHALIAGNGNGVTTPLRRRRHPMIDHESDD